MSCRVPASLRASGIFPPVVPRDEEQEGEERATGETAGAKETTTAATAAAAGPDVRPSSPPPRPRPSSSRPNAEARDLALVRLHAAACHRNWPELPGLAREAIAAGCGQAELRATLRHLIVCAGYAGSLAATSTLSEAKLLGPPTPGKLGGPPSDAFGLTYGVHGSRAVASRLHGLDPVLASRLRASVYGDLWADPGIPRSTRQLLMVGFLGEAGMRGELFGHAEAALACGCSPAELVAAAEEGFRAAARKASGGEGGAGAPPPPPLPERSRENYREAMKTLEAAWARHRSRFPEAAAAVKERERRRKTGSDGDDGDDGDASCSLPSPPEVLVAGHDASWWCCVPDLDLEDFSLGAERAPKGRGEEEEKRAG